MALTVTCETCGQPLGNPACAACRRAGASSARGPTRGPSPPLTRPEAVQGERRAPERQAPRHGGQRASDPRLTTRQIADRLGVSTNFIIGEILEGRLEATVLRRPGVRTVYRVAEVALEDYLRRHKWTSTGRG